MRIHCLDGTIVELNNEDVLRWQALRDKEDRLKRYEFGFPVTVTDQRTQAEIVLRTAPCGLGCRCAAEASQP